MTYREALRYLDSLANYETSGILEKRSCNLDRIKRLSFLFGNPHKKFKSLHVAGTKGKGSTASFAAAILRKAGFKTGLYTSPHIVAETERIRVNGRMIEKKDLARSVHEIKNKLKNHDPGLKPSYFEVFTQTAFNYFCGQNVDFGVFEVGLGGRLDATNIIEPLVAGITPISIDHTQFLGDNLISIAKEKSAIIKPGSQCVSSPQKKEALTVIKKRCSEVMAPLYIVGEGIKVKEVRHDDRKEVFEIKGLTDTYENCSTGLLGSHQVLNCATAVGMVEVLKRIGFKIPKSAIIGGIGMVTWPARLEVVRKNPDVILDGAQNRESANSLKRSLRRNFKYKNIFTIFGSCKDKDISGVMDELSDVSDIFILTKAKVPRAASPDEIENRIKNITRPVIRTTNMKEAYEKARAMAARGDAIVVTGSFYTIGDLKRILNV